MPFLSNIGTTELLIIAVIILVLFGGKKLTELAHGLGQSTKEIKNVKKEFKEALMEEKEELPQKTTADADRNEVTLHETERGETKGGV